jgi:hypothetical protein
MFAGARPPARMDTVRIDEGEYCGKPIMSKYYDCGKLLINCCSQRITSLLKFCSQANSLFTFQLLL